MNQKVLYRIYQVVLLIAYIALMTFFVVKCLETGPKSSESSQKVVEASAEVINSVSGEEKVNPANPDFQTLIRKLIGHYGFFVVLGGVSILLYLSIREIKSWIRIVAHFVAGFGFAILTEFALEGNTMGRGPSWKDVGIDSLGFITLSIFIILGYYFIYLRKYKPKTV